MASRKFINFELSPQEKGAFKEALAKVNSDRLKANEKTIYEGDIARNAILLFTNQPSVAIENLNL